LVLADEKTNLESPKPAVESGTFTSIESHLATDAKKSNWKKAAILFAFLAFASLFFLLFGWGELLENAQSASWNVLNSEFANAFAVLELSVIGFAALEFWRYTQLKREYAVVSGELQRTAIAEARQRKEALFAAYSQHRKAVQRVEFSTHWVSRLEISDREILRTVLEGLLRLATTPERKAEDVTDADVSNLRRYAPVFGGWDVQKFAAQLLEDGRIEESVFKEIEEFFNKLLRFRQPKRAAKILASLADQLNAQSGTTGQSQKSSS
jgi:DNA-binding ferritin-like protein (Dps family)